MVTVTVECPSNCCTVTMSTPRSNSREANVWRSLCHVTPLIPALQQANAKPRLEINERFPGFVIVENELILSAHSPRIQNPTRLRVQRNVPDLVSFMGEDIEKVFFQFHLLPGYSGACRSHIPRSNRSSVPRQTDQAFRGMPSSDSEVKPISNLGLSEWFDGRIGIYRREEARWTHPGPVTKLYIRIVITMSSSQLGFTRYGKEPGYNQDRWGNAINPWFDHGVGEGIPTFWVMGRNLGDSRTGAVVFGSQCDSSYARHSKSQLLSLWHSRARRVETS